MKIKLSFCICLSACIISGCDSSGQNAYQKQEAKEISDYMSSEGFKTLSYGDDFGRTINSIEGCNPKCIDITYSVGKNGKITSTAYDENGSKTNIAKNKSEFYSYIEELSNS